MAKKKKQAVDPQQQQLHDLIELKKMRQAAAEHREMTPDFPPDEEKIVPKTLKQKWDNYWYHYKGLTWGCLIGAVAAVWIVHDVFFAPKPDITLNIATETALSSINPEMEEDAYPYMADYNEDGEIIFSFSETSLGESSDPQMAFANYQKFIAVMAALGMVASMAVGCGGSSEEDTSAEGTDAAAEGEASTDLLYMLDDTGYDAVLEMSEGESMFIDFSKLYPGLEIADGDKLRIDDLALGKEWKLDRFEDQDFYLCLRYLGNSAKDKEKNQQTLESCLDFIHNIISSAYPEWKDKKPVYDPATMNAS